MTTQNDGGTAFPVQDHKYGMSLRTYIAVKAMQAIIGLHADLGADGVDYIARKSYFMADAMLREEKR